MLILWAEFWISKENWDRISHLRRLIQNNPIMRLSQKYLENRYDIAEQKEPNPKDRGEVKCATISRFRI